MTDTITPPEVSKAPGYQHQTLLVGEEIYLRRIEKGDAQLTTSWRESFVPHAPSTTETWITETIAKGKTSWFAIIRKHDDRIVGSLQITGGMTGSYVEAYVDPLFSAAGRWKAEAVRLVVPWEVDEKERMRCLITLASDDVETIAALTELGAWEATRSPGYLNRGTSRADLVRFAYLNRDWVAKLGDPREVPIERTGTGEPRPVPARGSWTGDPPKNAIAVGERVYLKPVDKADAEAVARWSRRETETYGVTRSVKSPAYMVGDRMGEQKDTWPSDIGFAVYLRENDTFIGEVALLHVDYLNRFAETASWMSDPAYRGNGYGFEAKHLLLEYAFETVGLLGVESFVAAGNTRSAAALRKQGYREVGVSPWASLRNGTFGNTLIFNLTADAWRALPRAAATAEDAS